MTCTLVEAVEEASRPLLIFRAEYTIGRGERNADLVRKIFPAVCRRHEIFTCGSSHRLKRSRSTTRDARIGCGDPQGERTIRSAPIGPISSSAPPLLDGPGIARIDDSNQSRKSRDVDRGLLESGADLDTPHETPRAVGGRIRRAGGPGGPPGQPFEASRPAKGLRPVEPAGHVDREGRNAVGTGAAIAPASTAEVPRTADPRATSMRSRPLSGRAPTPHQLDGSGGRIAADGNPSQGLHRGPQVARVIVNPTMGAHLLPPSTPRPSLRRHQARRPTDASLGLVLTTPALARPATPCIGFINLSRPSAKKTKSRTTLSPS